MKNVIIKSFVSVCKPRKRVFDTKRFLLVSTTALGDTLWATPAIAALRAGHKEAHICVLTSPIGREVLLHNPHVDALFVLQGPALRALCTLLRTLKKKQFSHILLFHTSQRPVLPCMALLGPEVLMGSTGLNKGLDGLLTHCLPVDPGTHEIERRLEIVKAVGGVEGSKELELYVSQRDRELADGIPMGRLLIALHPGAKDAFKQWPASHFIELGRRLHATLNATILVTGTPGEQPLVDAIASQIPQAQSITHLPLRAFAALLQKVDLMISNDTGAMHVAFAMRTPTVALFTPTNPVHCGPFAAKHVLTIAKAPTCTPCLRKKCASPFCLLQIGVDEVYYAVCHALADFDKRSVLK
jgi:ADP-heptose:LPS heptosyltransferase